MDTIHINKAKYADALRISILLQTVYIQAYAVDGISFEFANFIQEKFTAEKVEKKIKTAPESLWVCSYQDNPIGIAEIIFKSECPIRKIAIPELGKLYFLERFHGKGYAGQLMNKIEELLISMGYKELNLEVWIKNKKAIHFYEKNGFHKLVKVEFPMETNTYVNFVMHKVLI